MSIEEVIRSTGNSEEAEWIAKKLHAANIGDLTEVLEAYNRAMSITNPIGSGDMWKAIRTVAERFNKQGG